MQRLNSLNDFLIGLFSAKYILSSNIQVVLGVLLVLLYQWSLFEATSLLSMTAVLKGLIPCVIIIFNKSRYTFTLYLRGVVSLYLLIMVVFILWMVLASILFSTTLEFSVFQSLKFISRILAFMAFVTLASQQQSLLLILKMLVYVGLFSVIQYVLIIIFWGNVDLFDIPGTRGDYYGPLGILGSMFSWMYLPNGDVFLRANGYWYEPSHYSVYMFSIFFVSLYLYSISGLKKWKLYSILFLIVGACSLSMAGFLSFGIGIMLYANLSRPRNWMVYVVIGLFISVGALTSRIVPIKYLSPTIQALVKNKGGNDLNEMTSGRLNQSLHALSVFSKNPLGIGAKIPGSKEGENDDNYIKYASGNDYLLWLVMGGMPALLLLLFRDSLLFKYVRKDRLSIMAFVVCIENIVHAMIYDSLFSMMLLLFSAIVLSRQDQLSNVKKEIKCVGI